ncbi:hypothetical protein [Rickettsia endosymbiont of Halotydeus destructor]|uniref:hypothetical protein n=1 Tax=Rickettsia endosymbiont of Halotydeus destructor TaxID=2996754 RepID=UPI003BAFB042
MKVEKEDLGKDTNHTLIIEELNKSYLSYIKNKEAVIETGTIGITLGTVGLATLFGFGWVGVPLVIGSILFVGRTKEAYKKELLQALSIGELGDIEEIKKYYKQLPKDLREKWTNDYAFSKLADYLKMEFSKNDEAPNFTYPILDNIEEGWVDLSGKGE